MVIYDRNRIISVWCNVKLTQVTYASLSLMWLCNVGLEVRIVPHVGVEKSGLTRDTVSDLSRELCLIEGVALYINPHLGMRFTTHTAFSLNPFSEIITNKKLSKYLKSNQEIDDVFVKLKLNTAGEKLFENPKFLAWAQYVDDFNQKHQAKNSMLPTLVRQFGGDDLSIMLEKAKQADKTYGVALRLQGEQMKLWRREGLTTDTLFSIYKLDDGAKNLLENPGIKIWTRYADEFNPGEPTTLFKKLQKTYSNEALSQILIKGKTVSSTEKLASDLQDQQIRHWLATLEPPENVFKFLGLNKEADNLIGSPYMQTWLEYNAQKVNLIDTIRANYDTASMVSMVKTRPDTYYGKHLAYAIERDLVQWWVSAGKSFEFVTGKLETSSKKELEKLYFKFKKLQTAA